MTNIDTQRLAVDRDYWDEVSPDFWATDFCVDDNFFFCPKGYWSLTSSLFRGFSNPTTYDLVQSQSKRTIPRPTKPEPEVMSDNCLAARIGEIGNQIHNLGCENQNDEDLSGRLGELSIALWDLAKHAPKEPEPKEWDGETFPVPIGQKCECTFAVEHHDTWHKGKAVFHGIDPEGREYMVIDTGDYQACFRSLAHIRQIRTQAEREREELANLLGETVKMRKTFGAMAEDIIAAGWHKEPKP